LLLIVYPKVRGLANISLSFNLTSIILPRQMNHRHQRRHNQQRDSEANQAAEGEDGEAGHYLIPLVCFIFASQQSACQYLPSSRT
jgi:hypothetical protein